MENDIKLTKLAKCAGCGAKVGAGTLVKLLDGFKTHTDENLLVGYDKSDDASVYYLDENRALIQTTDFFPPIVDDPYLFGQIAATNALSDVYAMGGEAKLALNIMCITEKMDKNTVQEILRGGYDKVYEAGAIISGGHTIHGIEPFYGLAVSGFVNPSHIWKNIGARPGDLLILTKPLGIGIITTAAKADLVEDGLLKKIYMQMCHLNKNARDIMTKYDIHACTDVTGFSLMGHGCEMAQGSNVCLHFNVDSIPYHKEAYEFADMGFVPAGAYRNREFAEAKVKKNKEFARPLLDILFDPQTSGGLLFAISKNEAYKCLDELKKKGELAEIIGYVSDYEGSQIVLE